MCNAQVVLKKAGSIRFADVPAPLLKEEEDILNQLIAMRSEVPVTGMRQNEEKLRMRLGEVRDSLSRSSARYALLRKGIHTPLGELRREDRKSVV